ncbi:hypothetical protein LJB77_02240, partial [Ruminococcaceae bacterium OttesenSCG-928-N02]|nr:hypothetical protein [Ruminococcaceae bacterium OttesenSCG-928-N02]
MSNVFVGKFKNGDQLDKNYYRVETKYYNESKERHYSGMAIGDYVLPIKDGSIGKLLRFEEFRESEDFVDAIFSVVRAYTPDLSLIGNIVNCRFFQPDMNLLNKAIKSTKGIGFIPIALNDNCPDVSEMDFYKSKRRFFVCMSEKLRSQSFFKPSDICVVVSDTENRVITDIVEYNGQAFTRNDGLWNLYLEKTDNGAEQYTLQQLLDFAAEKNDNAPKKHKYLTAALDELAADGIFTADSPVALYDNVIVGRKQSAPSGKKQQNTDIVEADNSDDFEEDEVEYEDLTNYEQYAKLMAFNPNVILYGP